eukprot:s601_g5.t1
MLSTSVLSELPLADFLLSHQAVVVVAVHARRLKIVLEAQLKPSLNGLVMRNVPHTNVNEADLHFFGWLVIKDLQANHRHGSKDVHLAVIEPHGLLFGPGNWSDALLEFLIVQHYLHEGVGSCVRRSPVPTLSLCEIARIQDANLKDCYWRQCLQGTCWVR